MLNFLFALLCFLEAVYCSEDNCDIEVLFLGPDGSPYRVFFARGGVMVDSTPGGQAQDLREVLSEVILAGYSFSRRISEESKRNPLLYAEGVREAICRKRYFYSEKMCLCLSLMADALSSGSMCQYIDQNSPWVVQKLRKLSDNTVEWNVDFVSSHDFFLPYDFWDVDIKIFVRGSKSVLVGSVRCGAKHLDDDDGAESLLCAKRRLIDMQEKPVAQNLSDETSFEGFFSCGLCDPQRGVGLVYFPESGGQVSALFNVTGITITRVVGLKRVQESLNLFDVMFQQIFKGYELKPGVRSFWLQSHHADYSVCDSLCSRRSFLSRSLREALMVLAQTASCPERVLPGKGWRGLDPSYFDAMYSEEKTLLWIPVDKDSALECVAQNRCDPGTVLLSLNGYPAVLKGCPTIVDENMNESAVPARSMWRMHNINCANLCDLWIS